MNKIKSERAKKLFDTSTKLLNSDTSEIYDYYVSTFSVNEIVTLAEQDAEDRAKKAFCKATCNDGLYCDERNCHDMRAFIESLNNGGHSNE